ncbi:hypothetical protein DEU56DRAFT_909322 [Suillus clintonianus]|uniref:uncharacterized protein n=1 Tax=Suillus clintonianus TaxID=1904413 RepID=UPI001B85DA50|nr:uncharacterized protein DEU56DRAFT_909322 [Suillus clintonianus]KAG2147972.1 hypothetical protein DEU56DRAFT_909322 [Suillus clintonianus]
MLAKLEGKLEEAKCDCYAEQHIQSLNTGPTTSGDPFLAVANAAEKADIYPELDREDYPEIVYWHKSDYLSDHHGGRGVIRTTSTADSGAHNFITNEDGIVVSEACQREMCEKFRVLCFTLLLAGIKTESISHAFSCTHSTSSKSCKQPLSLTHVMSAPPHMKKTKMHTIATATADDSTSIDICSSTTPSSLVIVHEPAAMSIIPAALTTTTVDPDDSELTLTALLKKASFDNSPDVGEILPDRHSKVSFMEKLRASFNKQKESVAHSTPAISATAGTSKSSSNNTTDLGGILRKKHTVADSYLIMHTNSHSTTAWRVFFHYRAQVLLLIFALYSNLCTINWCKVNHKGTVGQFASYWDNLDAVAKRCGYNDRSKLVKAVKATAIASLPTAAALVMLQWPHHFPIIMLPDLFLLSLTAYQHALHEHSRYFRLFLLSLTAYQDAPHEHSR